MFLLLLRLNRIQQPWSQCYFVRQRGRALSHDPKQSCRKEQSCVPYPAASGDTHVPPAMDARSAVRYDVLEKHREEHVLRFTVQLAWCFCLRTNVQVT